MQANDAARTLLALDAQQDDDRAPRPEESVPARVLRGEVLTGERAVILQLSAAEGRVLLVEASGTPLRDPAGAVIGAVVVYRDVSERRAADEAVRQQAALLALAHERNCEAELAAALEAELAQSGVPELADLRSRFTPSCATAPPVSVLLPAIASYDVLLPATGAA